MPIAGVWIFTGDRGRFPSAAFEEAENAERWIEQHSLTGTLTLYPLNEGVFDWAVSHGHFEVKSGKAVTASLIQNFSSAYQEHYHFEDGRRVGA